VLQADSFYRIATKRACGGRHRFVRLAVNSVSNWSDIQSVLGRAKALRETLSRLLLIGAASALPWTVFANQPPAATAAPPTVQAVKDIITAEHLTNVDGSAALAIIEFTDFQCSFCTRHAKETLPTLKKALAGQARYIAFVEVVRLDTVRFQACLTGDAALRKVHADQAEAKPLAVSSTPVWFTAGCVPMVELIHSSASMERWLPTSPPKSRN
jgi:hypothetical protein